MKKNYFLFIFILTTLLFSSCSSDPSDPIDSNEYKLSTYEVTLTYTDLPEGEYSEMIALPVFLYFDDKTSTDQFIKTNNEDSWMFRNDIKGENIFFNMNYFNSATFKGSAYSFSLNIVLETDLIELEKATNIIIVVKKDGVQVENTTLQVAKYPKINYTKTF